MPVMAINSSAAETTNYAIAMPAPVSPVEPLVRSLIHPAFVMQSIDRMLRHSRWQIAQPDKILFNPSLMEIFRRFVAHCRSESIARSVLTRRATVDNILPDRQDGPFTYLFLGSNRDESMRYIRDGIDRKALLASFFSTDPEQCKSSAGFGPEKRKYEVDLVLTTARPVKDPNGRENVWMIPAESFNRVLLVATVHFFPDL
ncbi:hypothetical protein SELMODRAFT_419188 [Selaginella moellendorffii]|uniref:Uncharacterized protein n=1 Tax=Selaginella moellendorffii TaxID=88036 RepID=D8S847_SELML|nr:hypothetical protein SELMODRAFT_419188 [Selaginella moellendorffii]